MYPDNDCESLRKAVVSLRKLNRLRRRQLGHIMPQPLADFVHAMERINGPPTMPEIEKRPDGESGRSKSNVSRLERP